MRQRTPPWNIKKQSGYILLYVTILLIALVFASGKFLERTMMSMKSSGENRDSAESLLLAESAMNLVYGQFIFDGDVDGNGAIENEGDIDNRTPINLNNALPNIELHYIYYMSDGSGINRQIPAILQWVANGEAIAQGDGTVGQIISPSTSTLVIADLFSSDHFPLLYATDETGNLVKQNKSITWETSIATKKAAVWMELVRNPADDGGAQLYVQSAAQVGNAKSYVQRYVGAYEQTSGLLISPLNQVSQPISQY